MLVVPRRGLPHRRLWKTMVEETHYYSISTLYVVVVAQWIPALPRRLAPWLSIVRRVDDSATGKHPVVVVRRHAQGRVWLSLLVVRRLYCVRGDPYCKQASNGLVDDYAST